MIMLEYTWTVVFKLSAMCEQVSARPVMQCNAHTRSDVTDWL